jgi:hypothetical protein
VLVLTARLDLPGCSQVKAAYIWAIGFGQDQVQRTLERHKRLMAAGRTVWKAQEA